MSIDWNVREQAAPPAVSARVVVCHTLEWLRGPGCSPGSLFARRLVLTRVFEGMAAVMDLHAADANARCSPCSVTPGLAVAWPCETWVRAATAVHGLPKLAVRS